MENKTKILVSGVVIAAIIFGGIYFLVNIEQEESGVHLVYEVFRAQGAAENLSGMESVKVNGTVCNIGDKEAKNVTVNVIFTDTAHNEVVRKTVREGVGLLPD